MDFEFPPFLETENQDLSKGLNINLIRALLRLAVLEESPAALQGSPPQKTPGAINSPKHPSDQGGTHFSEFLLSV